MLYYLTQSWLWFVIAFGVMLLATVLMSIQSRYLYTMDVVVRKFGILDLEFASTAQELTNILKGIYQLPLQKSYPAPEKVVSALRAQIIIDFVLFMPAAYGGIFIACTKIAEKMDVMQLPFFKLFFTLFAWLQLVAFILDGIENVYLLQKIKPHVKPSTKITHKMFQLLEVLKWGFALIATISALLAMLYFWVTKKYADDAIPYVWIILIEIFVFVIISKLIKPDKVVESC